MKNKNSIISKNSIKKRLTKILLGTILMIVFSPTAFAKDTFKCEDLNVSEVKGLVTAEEANKNVKKLEDYIITVLEEEIGSSTVGSITPDEGSAESMTCFRVTKCQTADGKTSCSSYYGSTCKPGENIFCQRVQVLISQSGVDLLMSYLGIIYQWAASVIGIVSVAYLIYGGFLIGTAQDDTSKIDKAKEKIVQSIAGLVLLFLSAVILYTINPNFFAL